MRDPDDDTGQRRLFGTPKNNLGRDDLPTFSFTITGHAIDTDEGTAWTGRLNWGDELTATIEDVMSRAVESGDDKSATSEAADWLADYLASKGGQVPCADAKRAGRAAGHSEASVKRARIRLDLVVTSVGFPRSTFWELPPEMASSGRARAGGEPDEPTEPTGEKEGVSVGERSSLTTTTTTTQSALSAQSAQVGDYARASQPDTPDWEQTELGHHGKKATS